MAQRSRSRGGSRSGGSRSGGSRSGGSRSGGRSRGGGGYGGGRAPQGGGQGPMLIAIVLVVGAVGLFLALGGSGKKKQDKPTPQPSNNQPVQPVKPANATPQRPPAPRIDNAKKKEGDALIAKMRPLYDEAEALYNEAREIKNSDRKEYQRLLSEANDQLSEVRDLWNQIEEMMPENMEWGADEVADHYFGRAYSKIGKVDELMMAVKKQMTAN